MNIKKSYVYFLLLEDKTAFKIGMTTNPLKRISYLHNYYKFNLDESFMIKTDNAYLLENSFHSMYDNSRLSKTGSGGTEFFDYDIFDSVKKTVKSMSIDSDIEICDVTIEQIDSDIDDTDIILSGIGSAIKQRRIALKYKQQDLANKCNVSRRTILNLENGRSIAFSCVIKIMCNIGMIDALMEIIEPQVDKIVSKRQRVRTL